MAVPRATSVQPSPSRARPTRGQPGVAGPRAEEGAPAGAGSLKAPKMRTPAKVAVPDEPRKDSVEEPVWLVRAVLVLFFVGFAAFLAREVYGFVQSLP